MADDEVGQQESKLGAGAGAGDGAGSLRCRRRGREEDDESSKLSLLSAPPEVLSVILLFLEGATLAQASCVSKVGNVCRLCTYRGHAAVGCVRTRSFMYGSATSDTERPVYQAADFAPASESWRGRQNARSARGTRWMDWMYRVSSAPSAYSPGRRFFADTAVQQ